MYDSTDLKTGNGSTETFYGVAQYCFCDVTKESGSTEPRFGFAFGRTQVSVRLYFSHFELNANDSL